MQKTEALWEDAEHRAPELARELARMELALCNWGPVTASRDSLEAAIRSGWHSVVASARKGSVSLEPSFVASLHALIAQPIDSPGAGVFHEGQSPMDWTEFKRALDDAALEYGMADNTEAWLLAQLYWGPHLESLGLSVAWLLGNGFRLQEGGRMVVPNASHDEKLKERLKWAGPDLYDAEGLRGFFGWYETERTPG
ncbi:hypothetical protein [Variovorax sp. E3]|uniref:hypothetical protein n=1 Tax=Variovorax sp. E3 TaxID=1914993 RepID=UPI0018DC7AC2|nr:hypothetical protein [Variovorax sp. E3]